MSVFKLKFVQVFHIQKMCRVQLLKCLKHKIRYARLESELKLWCFSSKNIEMWHDINIRQMFVNIIQNETWGLLFAFLYERSTLFEIHKMNLEQKSCIFKVTKEKFDLMYFIFNLPESIIIMHSTVFQSCEVGSLQCPKVEIDQGQVDCVTGYTFRYFMIRTVPVTAHQDT